MLALHKALGPPQILDSSEAMFRVEKRWTPMAADDITPRSTRYSTNPEASHSRQIRLLSRPGAVARDTRRALMPEMRR
jgi:hypothetical protein